MVGVIRNKIISLFLISILVFSLGITAIPSFPSKHSGFRITDFNNNPIDPSIFFNLYEDDAFFNLITQEAFFNLFNEDAFFSLYNLDSFFNLYESDVFFNLYNQEAFFNLFNEQVFFSLYDQDSFFSLFNIESFFSLFESDAFFNLAFFNLFDQEAFFTLFNSETFYSLFENDAFYSLFDANAFFSLFQAEVFFSLTFFSLIFSQMFNNDAFFSLIEGEAFFNLVFFSLIFFNLAFFNLFDIDVFFSLYGMEAFYSLVFFNLAFFSLAFFSLVVFRIVFFSFIEGEAFLSLTFFSLVFFNLVFFNLFAEEAFFNLPFFNLPFFSLPFFSLPFFSLPFFSLPFFSLPFFSLPFFSLPFFSLPFFSLFASDTFFSLPFFNLNQKGHDQGLRKANWNRLLKRLKHLDFSEIDPEIPWNIARVFGSHYTGDEHSDSSVQVAVLDTGIVSTHSDLSNNIKWTYDATGNGFEDHNGHGTHVSGIISAQKNGFGVAGIMADAEIYAIKVIDSTTGEGEWPWLKEAIYKAVAGPDGIVGNDDDADVINMSFGSGTEVPPGYVHDAIKWAYNHGVTIVAAGGNTGDSDPSTNEINYPAAYDEVIAVGASTYLDEVAEFSSSGSYIELTAPGDIILSTYLDNSYAYWGGTSMSTPHVSGLVALIIAEYGHLPVGTFDDMGQDTIRGILHTYARDFGSSGWDPEYGYGIVSYL